MVFRYDNKIEQVRTDLFQLNQCFKCASKMCTDMTWCIENRGGGVELWARIEVWFGEK